MTKAPPAPEEPVRIARRNQPSLVIQVERQTGGVGKKVNGASPVFYHTGDLGDILAALSAMKALGGGRLQIGPDIGFPMGHGQPRQPGSPTVLENIYDLLILQPYIASVEYRETQQMVDYNFNLFRTWMGPRQAYADWQQSRNLTNYLSLATAQQGLFGVRLPDRTPWLEVDSPWPCDGKPIVIQRSARYHNNPDTFPWGKIVENYAPQIIFVGLEEEHAAFCRAYGNVHYFWCGNILRMARLIAGAKVFIGNQSAPFWLAEGLKQNLILEGWDGDPNCECNRPGHHSIFDGDWPRVRKLIQGFLE